MLSVLLKKSSIGELLLQYHIADRNEGNDDVDEQGGSRSFPSRTFYGQQWEICKERPWLAEPLRFLGIPITPPFYYLLRMSCRQVELMCADCAVTVYPKTDTVKDGKGKEHKFNRPSLRSLNEAKERFAAWDDVKNPTFDLSGFSFS